MSFPLSIQHLKPLAEKYLAEGRVREIEFSGGTYQIQVIDAKTEQEVWAFLQLDARGEIRDAFCSCEESEDPCVHIAAAYLRIFKNHTSPLHQRFEPSLWNKLCKLYKIRMGNDPAILKKIDTGSFVCFSPSGKTIFSVKAKTKEGMNALMAILEHRQTETEETSLKFSNLSQNELALWREGRPSLELSYELSFWSDLAKRLLIYENEGKQYQIQFNYSSKGLPSQITIIFPDLEMSFYISEANLPQIIPSLVHVHSPLAVHHTSQDRIKKITYDKEKGILILEAKKSHLQRKLGLKKGIPLSGWVYIADDGFYAQDQQGLFSESQWEGSQISQALNDYFPIIQPLLEEVRAHEDPITVSYSIAFDDQWNLHVTSYLFTPGDLSLPHSKVFDNWVYIENEGFYRVEAMRFQEIDRIVSSDQVSEFVQHNRTWLSTQEGFQIHLTSVEAQTIYHVNAQEFLVFERQMAIKEEKGKSKDFGSWVYLVGQGFYAKGTIYNPLMIKSGLTVNSGQIPFFIRTNKDELQLIPGFFTQTCPVTKSGLTIELDEREQIHVNPIYHLEKGYENKRVLFFDDYVYVENEGFSELPVEMRLPEKFHHPILVENQNVPLFLTYEWGNLQRYIDQVDSRLTKPERVRLIIEEASQEADSYHLKLKYQTEKGEAPLTDFWKAFQAKKRFLFHEAGLFDLEDKRYSWIKLLSKKQVALQDLKISLSTLELIRLNALEDLTVAQNKEGSYIHSIEILEELTQFKIPEEPDLEGLKSQLRSYQVIGVRWLWFLYEHRLSGLLCDDMGLGKTHQAMALLAAIINQHKKKGSTHRHFLVVCPTSVIYHWQEKLQNFLPNLRICTFHGSLRSLGDFQHDYDLLLTSYGIWRIENELLSQVKFELAIFDEIQIAKNHTSRIYNSLLKVDTKMRLGLTGTPIENHLRELKSLFDIVLPTYMPQDSEYRESFVKPIEKEGNPQRKEALSRLIHPFVMRRKKEDVLLDLPEKIQEISHCELLPEQESLYNEVLHSARDRILNEMNQDKAPIPFIHIFALLSKLKQICSHPAIYYKKIEDYKLFQSGKWDLFLELLNEARESRQKVVVFSQYLGMLDIIQLHLEEAGIGFAGIRGSTINRAEQLRRFNQDPDCEVFVASLQASGLGIDLTAGSVVIHYDRWWNAARENQATDRVHRIGQTRGVQVFKLVTVGTLEERIDILIDKKGALMEEVVGTDDHRLMKQFTREEIMELLQDAITR
jgi:SNF2 family DNA or RNA helicase